MARRDILLDDENELVIVDGDFDIGDSDNQHAAIIFEAQKGEIRSSPELGFGVSRYIKKRDGNVMEFMRNLKVELEKDGYNDATVDVDQDNGTLKIEVE